MQEDQASSNLIYNKIRDIIKLLKLLETKQSPKVGFFDILDWHWI